MKNLLDERIRIAHVDTTDDNMVETPIIDLQIENDKLNAWFYPRLLDMAIVNANGKNTIRLLSRLLRRFADKLDDDQDGLGYSLEPHKSNTYMMRPRPTETTEEPVEPEIVEK